MTFELSKDQQKLRKRVADFSRSELNDGVVQRYRDGVFPRDLFELCAKEVGLQGLCIDKALGGSGLDPLTTAAALEGFGYGCEDGGFVFAVGAHLLACVVPIATFSTDAQKKRLFPALCDGSVVVVNAMTEPSAGSDMAGVKAVAERNGDRFRITGTKSFGTNGPVADVAMTFAWTTPPGGGDAVLTPFIVDTKAPGVTVKETFDLADHRTASIGLLELEGVEVSEGDVLGAREGTGVAIFNHAMTWERVGLFAAHVGAMDRILEATIDFARRRKAFGQPIGRFQGVSHLIAELKTKVEAARLLVYRAACRLDKSRAGAMDASMAKLAVSEAYVEVARAAVEVHGGVGCLTDLGFHRELSDAVASTIYSGANNIQKNIIAGWLGL